MDHLTLWNIMKFGTSLKVLDQGFQLDNCFQAGVDISIVGHPAATTTTTTVISLSLLHKTRQDILQSTFHQYEDMGGLMHRTPLPH